MSFFGKVPVQRRAMGSEEKPEWAELGGYWTFDVKAMMEVFKNTVAEIGVRNMFDATYETAYGFPREGRTLFFGFRGVFLRSLDIRTFPCWVGA